MFPTDETSDRGQILVIVGLLIAVMLVALALVLNAAIFTENLSTRETADSEEPSSYAADTGSTVADVYNRTNDNDTRKAVYANTSFNESLETWADSRSDTAAENGALFVTNWTAYVGWRLEQTENRSFTRADNDSKTAWNLSDGTNVRDVSTFEMRVNRTSLFNATGDAEQTADEAFRLVVTDEGGTVWEMYLFEDGTKTVLYVGDPSGESLVSDLIGSNSCETTADPATVDLRAGTLEGPCGPLTFADGLSGELTVRYENVRKSTGGTERVNGTYTLVVNGSDAVATNTTDHPERFNVSGKMPPTATAVVYAVRYDTRYQRKEVVHDVEGWHSPRAEAYQSS
jgi:hypothetical protein